ncbi:SDR family NAD(P)-dependent oxidoreductase [Altererythrobacter sp. SALINAS58]|uniref:SDR family NAD(P)-dependent oxidoreductase n=1 Tax=Alteripontixanthobacter muriae TaxID=2705546 RepID=UPI0015759FDD|nr:SDR family NAD(P)-dependent oxidoreductase [Alteripontixanthobacter muriae]NTZ42525.1 SDR family NAD(P)-dependent oxidoreductase [Alteripontixanthobacter muriae]
MTNTIWITGASSGIGRALALEYAGRGKTVEGEPFSLILSGRDEGRLAAVAEECACETLVLPFEMTDEAAMQEAVRMAEAWQEGFDMLVNNAGISQRSQAINTKMDVYRRILDIDLLAPIALTQEVLGGMVSRGSGKLVFMASIAGKVGVPLRTAYCAAKHGLIGYADALRTELSVTDIEVHVVAPGSVATDVSRNALGGDGDRRGVSDKAIDEGIPPAEAARIIADAIALNQREIIVARGMEEAMGELRRTPDQLFDQMANMVAKGYMEKMEPQGS